MSRRNAGWAVRLPLAGCALCALTVVPALAWSGSGGPLGEFSFQIGYFTPQGNSDLWDENSDLFTSDPSDFADVIWSGAVGWYAGPHLDVILSAQYYQADTSVRYRDITGEYGDPVRQYHYLYQAPFEVTLRVPLIPRAERRGSSGVRVLSPVVPYVGAGAGFVWWEYEEEGEFVDDPDDPMFAYPDYIESDGVAPSLHALGGVEIQVSPWVGVQLEGRYRWAEGDLGGEFGPARDEIDLSGWTLSAGMSFRF